MSYLETTRISDVFVYLKNILNLLQRPLWTDPTTGRVNINNVTSLTTVTTVTGVTTVSTVTSLSQMAGFDIKQTLMYSNERTNWGMNIRNNIT